MRVTSSIAAADWTLSVPTSWDRPTRDSGSRSAASVPLRLRCWTTGQVQSSNENTLVINGVQLHREHAAVFDVAGERVVNPHLLPGAWLDISGTWDPETQQRFAERIHVRSVPPSRPVCDTSRPLEQVSMEGTIHNLTPESVFVLDGEAVDARDLSRYGDFLTEGLRVAVTGWRINGLIAVQTLTLLPPEASSDVVVIGPLSRSSVLAEVRVRGLLVDTGNARFIPPASWASLSDGVYVKIHGSLRHGRLHARTVALQKRHASVACVRREDPAVA